MTLNKPSAAALLSKLKSGEMSAEAMMRATLDRIAEVNGEVNAIVALRDERELLEEARAADREATGGALFGLPMAVKDLVNVRGLPTTMGTPSLKDNIAERDDLMVARMRAAGAIFIGKTNTPEFGLGSHTFNPVWGSTVNPYDTARSCGGSSGGAAVALATGMLALADGSDMMGSLRNPAAWNNVYGFRPSWGLVPSEPLGDSFLHQLSTLGPMACDPGDIAILLDVIAGPDPRQPHGRPHSPIAPLAAATLEGQRIGWLGDWGGAFPMEAGVMDTCQSACRVFEECGAVVKEVAPPFSAEALWESWTTLRSWQVGASLLPFEARKETLKDTAVWELERGQALTAMEVHRASVIRSEWFRAAEALFDSYDALMLPAAQVWPFEVSQDYPTEVAGRAMDTYHRWMEVMVPVSLAGLPCLGMPAGFGPSGLPMGVQLFGRRGGDAALLALGQAYHAATYWPQERPAMI